LRVATSSYICWIKKTDWFCQSNVDAFYHSVYYMHVHSSRRYFQSNCSAIWCSSMFAYDVLMICDELWYLRYIIDIMLTWRSHNDIWFLGLDPDMNVYKLHKSTKIIMCVLLHVNKKVKVKLTKDVLYISTFLLYYLKVYATIKCLLLRYLHEESGDK